MDVKEQILKIGADAKAASRELAKLSTRKKNTILEAMAKELDAQRAHIQAENAKDLEAGRENDGVTPSRCSVTSIVAPFIGAPLSACSVRLR